MEKKWHVIRLRDMDSPAKAEVACDPTIEVEIREYLDRPWHLVAWAICEAGTKWVRKAKFDGPTLHELPTDIEQLSENKFRSGRVEVELVGLVTL